MQEGAHCVTSQFTRFTLPEKPLAKPTTPEEWAEVYRLLSQPLPPAWVSFRADSAPMKRRNGAPGEFVRVVGYIDRSTVTMVLNAVCGVGCWSFRFKPLSLSPAGEVVTGLGRLQLWDTGVHEDVGSQSNQDPSKGCASDTLKRTASQVGIATYLSNLPGALFCDIERWGDGKSDWKLSKAGLDKLYAILAAWDGKPDTWGQTRPAATVARPVTEYGDDDAQESRQAPGQDARQDSGTHRTPPPTPSATPATRAPATRAATPAPTPAPTPGPSSASAEGQESQESQESRGDADMVGQPGYIQQQQFVAIGKLSQALGRSVPTSLKSMTFDEAKKTISGLSAEYQAARRAS
jgi:hypothetical protein